MPSCVGNSTQMFKSAPLEDCRVFNSESCVADLPKIPAARTGKLTAPMYGVRIGALALAALLWACAPITPLFPQPSSNQPPPSGASGPSSPSGGSPGRPGPSSPSGGSPGMPGPSSPSGGSPGMPGPSSPSGGVPGSSGGSPGTPGPSGSSSGLPGLPGSIPGMPGVPGVPGVPGMPGMPDGMPRPPGAPGTPPGGQPDSGGDAQGADGAGSMPADGPPGSGGGGGATPGGNESLPSGSGGATQGSGSPDGESGAQGNGTGSQGTGTLPQSGAGGWETSNEIPPATQPRPAPPMPGERPGSGGDQELEEALGTFDGEILAEREVLEQRSNETPSGSGGVAGAPTAATGGAQSGRQSPGGAMPAPPSRPTPPMPRGAAPDDIPDARDDDIIARQLREAAMAESDPELREALWEEYRRYRGS